MLETDTGIEIKIPMEEYKDPDKVEFITNPDGTISVLIKKYRAFEHQIKNALISTFQREKLLRFCS